MKQIIKAEGAPEAIGPYSHGVAVGDLFFTSGQIPLVPETKKLVGKDIESQTRQVFANLKAVLEANGMDFSNVVKSMVFLVDLADFTKFNAIYGEYFPSEPPARSCVQVSALPQGAHVEIEMIAAK